MNEVINELNVWKKNHFKQVCQLLLYLIVAYKWKCSTWRDTHQSFQGGMIFITAKKFTV